ncbi:hypothetical protein ACMFL9_32220 (plasmid) [Sinorhizobium meliloti]
MEADVATTNTSSSLRFKVEGLDCQNEVRALRAAVAPLVGGDDRLSFNTQTGVMDVLAAGASMIDAIQRAVATTGMQAHLLRNPVEQPGAALLFQVEGLDCKNEVAALKREVGPLVGGENCLSFDTAKGLMTVAPQRLATADDIVRRVAPTGMRASQIAGGTAETLLYRVHGLDCKNEVAALTQELGPLVGEDKLAFDIAQGTMTVASQSRATPAQSRRPLRERACAPKLGRRCRRRLIPSRPPLYSRAPPAAAGQRRRL